MGSNTFTGGYADGNALTKALLDTAYQTLQLDISNTSLMTTGSSDNQVLTSTGSGTAAAFEAIPDPLGPFALRNYGLNASATAGVLTIKLKTKALTDPSASDVVNFNYSTNGTTSASYSSVNITSATSIPINASATLGFVSTSTARIFVYGYYNTLASAVKLAVSARPDLDIGEAIAFTAMSTTADSSHLRYATGTLTAVPRLLGWVEAAHNSGGSWQSATKVNITQNSQTSPFEANRAGTTSSARIGQLAISASTGSFSTTNTTYTDVTNASVTITTTGRPVFIGLVADGTNNESRINTQDSGGSPYAYFQLLRGTVTVGVYNLAGGGTAISVPASSMQFIDTFGAGIFTYKLQCKSLGAGDETQVTRAKLIVYEIG